LPSELAGRPIGIISGRRARIWAAPSPGVVVGLVTVGVVAAGLSQLLDPVHGRRRRALVRDKITRAARVAGDALDTTGRDMVNRLRGVAYRLRGDMRRGPVPDGVLADRVRARLGGVVGHPRAIDVSVADGTVTLRGPVLAAEIGRLLAFVAAVPGVRDVDDELDIHEDPNGVPELQDEPARARGGARFEFWQEQWSPTARVLAATAGSALAVCAVKRMGIAGALMGGAGLTLVARAATNLPLGRLAGVGGGRDSVTVQKTIEVHAPVEEVHDLWSRYEAFPRFMAHVLQVERRDAGRARWTVTGPAGIPITFETVETQHVPSQLIAWRTLDGAPVAHDGVVRFDRVAGGTRIHVRMSYTPPAGAIGHGLAVLLGSDPLQQMHEDLVRLKSLLEDGKTSVRGLEVTRERVG
jgi:uncharacterized membrane protein